MNLPSEEGTQVGNPVDGKASAHFLAARETVSPFEFRSLSAEDAEESTSAMASADVGENRPGQLGCECAQMFQRNGQDRAIREAAVRSAVEVARQQGIEAGELQGRRAGRAEMEAELTLCLANERQQVAETVRQFRLAKDRYFADVEQEVVKLALAIAERVLHREAEIDPLLLTGVVRVAMEKMADRSGVVLRVAGSDVEAWERVFHSAEASERPRVAEDARLERGECVLETQMGTVELGVKVQLEEIEKGFFDLLHHRPVE